MRRIIVSISLALKNLRHNKARTALTLVGIVIGIMSILVISSSGQGVKEYILGQFQSYGNDIIQVETKVPSTGKTSTANATGQAMGIAITTLKDADGEAIMRLPNVIDYVPGTIGQEIASYKGQNKRSILFGTGASMPRVDTATKVEQGNFYTENDDKNLEQVVVIGADVKDALFPDENAVGKSVKIKDMNFKVIGVLARRGAVTFFNYDDLIYVPVQTLEKKILGINYVRYITLKVRDVSKIDITVLDVQDLLKRRHNTPRPEQEDFSITTMQEAQKMIDDVFGTINILLLALTSISLIVGGVGIMNVMYVAVVERTFEIGLRKAVGARPGDIRNQFLLEAVVITMIGGIVGILLGYCVAFAFSYIISLLGFSLRFPITLSSVLLATGFSASTGIIFGFYPAWKASQLSPMEALRKE